MSRDVRKLDEFFAPVWDSYDVGFCGLNFMLHLTSVILLEQHTAFNRKYYWYFKIVVFNWIKISKCSVIKQVIGTGKNNSRLLYYLFKYIFILHYLKAFLCNILSKYTIYIFLKMYLMHSVHPWQHVASLPQSTDINYHQFTD